MPNIKDIPIEEICQKPISENPVVLPFEDDVLEAYSKYQQALFGFIAEKDLCSDFYGNYARFPEQAMRKAALFASLKNKEKIKLNHWARAQSITERLRMNLHRLHYEISQYRPTRGYDYQERILRIIKKFGNVTKRELNAYTKLSYDEIENALNQLMNNNVIENVQSKRCTRYRLKENQEQKDK